MKTFNNVASLQASHLQAGTRVLLKGYTTAGDGGGSYLDVSDTASGLYFTLANGKYAIRDLDTGCVTLKMFGGVPDYDRDSRTGTDNQPALEQAESACLSLGLKLVIDGDYGVGSATVAQPIVRHGTGPEASGLFALNDSHRVYTWSASLTSGSSVMHNFTIQGYAQDNTTQGTDDDALVEISPIDAAYFIDMKGSWGRQMAFKSRAKLSWAERVELDHILRDGINFTDAEIRIIRGVKASYVADDPIACHSNSTNVKTTTIIDDVELFNTYGIKCLSSRFSINNVRGRMVFGYGIQYGRDSGYSEGAIPTAMSTIDNVNIENIINLSKVGGGNIGAGVLGIHNYETNSNGVYPNKYDSTLGSFVDPLENLNTFGNSDSSAGSFGISIGGNVNFSQTWTGGTTISDYGDGEAWTTGGFSDISLTGTLAKDGNICYAYRFDGNADNIKVRPGFTYGMTSVYLFQNALSMDNFDGEMGTASRIYDKAISIVKDSSITYLDAINSKITGGSLDMDPLHEHPDRDGLTGAWTDTGGINCNGIYAPSVRGFVWSGTSCRNIQRMATVSGGTAIRPFMRDLIIYTGDGVGVGSVQWPSDQNLVYTDCVPTSGTYGEVLQGRMEPQSTLPTSDYYFAGQRIKNSDLSATIDSGNLFTDLIRLTTGNSHVLGTDWSYIKMGL